MGKQRKLTDITSIILHCAATPNGRADTVEDIDRYHKERKFKRSLFIAPKHQPHLKHIGYHYVIEIDGSICAGRPLTETGAHAKGHNNSTIGICLIGNDKFTPEQWAALSDLRHDLERILHGPIMVYGHHEVNANKTCPGFDVQAYIRNRWTAFPEHILQPEELNKPQIKPTTLNEEKPMGWMSLLGSIVKPAADLIDELHTSDEEKLKIKQAMFEAQNKLTAEVLGYEKEILAAKSQIIVAEAQGKSWIQRNWRPITMLTFLVLIIADTFGWTEFRLSEQAWELLKLGIGGYVVGRSAEKIMPNVLQIMKERK